MILTDTRNHEDIGSIPLSRAKTVDMCISHLGGTIIGKDDPRWSDKGDNVVIKDNRYRYEDLAIADQLVTDGDIYAMLKRAADYQDADTYAHDVYLSPYFINVLASDSFQPNPKVEGQLRILWHAANDPFQVLLDNTMLTPKQCSDRFAIDRETLQRWIDGDEPAPVYVRLMIAEGTGLLKLRYF